ncbi:hypothetical protein [Streptomyces stelliscabiei]|uniref:hypothetical protein n=1 Tax=Streptomyces stelliscabiei TaxID=146820 RepID=UPI0029AC88D3|nr:hypothetical protein [Streptomyces stelliscabiei]MDX2667420.1 hypothetical protein [Streptomyces stelliscabiei]MDX2785959.1 hypothetical protein [Streptomyces stelliscabiei]
MTETRHPVPTPPAQAPPVPYERTRWESAVLARHLHHRTLAVALVLSHHAGPGGILAEDGVQRTDRMRELTLISHRHIRDALRYLEGRGLLERPPLGPETSPKVARAVVLTIPARRERPPHTGEQP